MNILEKISWKLFIPAVLLTLFGLLSVFSISYGSGDLTTFWRQLVYLGISLTIAFLVGRMDLRSLKNNSHLILFLYIISFLLLLGLILFGTYTRGIRGWYNLGFFNLDPVPLAAMVLIVFLSKYFSTRHVEVSRVYPIIHSGFFAVVLAFLVFLQPDLGSALTLMFVWLGIIIFSGIKFKHLFVIFLIFLVLVFSAWFFVFEDYQKGRILSFLNPDIDPQGVSWNLIQSQVAIGSGGILGKGFLNGSQIQYGFLPEARTDFIFSSIAEEFGLIGIGILLTIMGYLFYQILRVGLTNKNNFTRLFAAGFAFLFLSQSIINIGMCLGLMPVIGIPLPFISYGGSQLFGFYFGLGVLSSLKRS